MAKTIAIADDVYDMLVKAKMKGESFSDVIRRLLKRQKISDIPKILNEEEAEEIKKLIELQRKADLERFRRTI
mgnify:CR=1 FL=1|jgi:predicted CopG family antitoxin